MLCSAPVSSYPSHHLCTIAQGRNVGPEPAHKVDDVNQMGEKKPIKKGENFINTSAPELSITYFTSSAVISCTFKSAPHTCELAAGGPGSVLAGFHIRIDQLQKGRRRVGQTELSGN